MDLITFAQVLIATDNGQIIVNRREVAERRPVRHEICDVVSRASVVDAGDALAGQL